MKTILVTGATDGIGKATAEILAKQGHRVIVHGRSRPKVEQVVAELRQALPSAEFSAVAFDLGQLAAIRRGAEELRQLLGPQPLDVLINNAGIFAHERCVTGDGAELTLAVNHLAPVLLTELLLEALAAGHGARIINVASIAHSRGAIDRNDLMLENGYTGYRAYAQSKLANILHARGLARRFSPAQLCAYSLHPGVIATKLLREGFGAQGSPVESGANTSVWLATADDSELAAAGVHSGAYVVDCKAARPAAAALDDELADWLWDRSRALVGLPAFRMPTLS